MEIGAGEIILISFVLMVIFSASRVGRLGDALGRFVYSFKRAASGKRTVDVTPSRFRGNRTAEEDAQVVSPAPGKDRRASDS
jgi:sec-independent protein translocase protein TatA